ncbi:50S ribosomal protein L18 [Alphaproteobacteria bacterium]|jgi:large subunit ribosomal protein L18|nr:50S ribosomal protein L18 [Alphaproteobacteria bacterium]
MIDKRTKRIRTKLKKVSSRNRLSVFRSNNHIYAQAIDDSKGITIASASTLEKELVKDQKARKELAATIGKEIAKRLIEKGIKDVAFDKGGYKYHGLIKILAESAREEGLNF